MKSEVEIREEIEKAIERIKRFEGKDSYVIHWEKGRLFALKWVLEQYNLPAGYNAYLSEHHINDNDEEEEYGE